MNMNNYILPFLWMRGEKEEIIREEISKIDFCGIKAVCVEARPHKDFCGPGWWHDMDIVIDEAKKRNMRIWILDDKHFPTGYANGLIESRYPERKKQYLACTVCDVFGSRRPHELQVSRMMKPTIGFWQIGQPVNEKERANNRVVSIVAVPFAEGGSFHEKGIDLTGLYDGGDRIRFELPEGQWRIHVIYTTRTDGGNESYINMIDAVSAHTQIEGVYEAHYQHYGDLFGTVIAGFFSDEPQLGNITDQSNDTRLGRPGMPLPWSVELADMLKERWRDNYLVYLALLFADSADHRLQPQIRYDYMDCVSRLYERDFSRPIGEWCHAHGVEYIGHVVEDNGLHSRLGLGAGHWFRAMSGQDMAGIDSIGGQIVYGAPVQQRMSMGPLTADGEFFHYTLGKLGASGGHLDPKKKGRTMCELFGAYGWNFGVRDMKHLLDHLLVRGVNYLVPHAFSMAEYPDFDCPPHFYARGNNPEFPFFAELMKYANRMCGVLNGGKHPARIALLYDAEADWTGKSMPMQKVCRVLMTHQIDFDIVSLDMLADLPAWNGSVGGGKLNINGEEFDTLLIPYAQYLPERLLAFCRKDPGFPVFFIGGYPEAILMDEKRIAPEDDTWKQRFGLLAPENLAGELQARGWAESLLDQDFPDLSVYFYEKDGKQILMLFNESADRNFRGRVKLPFSGDAFYEDLFEEIRLTVKADEEGRAVVELPAGGSCLLVEKNEEEEESIIYRPLSDILAGAKGVFDLSGEWMVSAVKAIDYPAFGTEKEEKSLRPYSEDHPDFSGVIRYRKSFHLKEKWHQGYLSAEQVFDVFRVTVNGKKAGICLTPPYTVDLRGLLQEGENEIICEVATTPAREQRKYPSAPFDFCHEVTDPTGMSGKIRLYLM